MTRADRARLGAGLATAGAVLGAAAGVVQATAGSDIPSWTGGKADPVGLGLATIALSVIAFASSTTLRRPHIRGAGRLIATAGLVVPGLVCFTTVGRLWLLPGPLLLAGAALAVEDWCEAARLTRRGWLRVLLASLGGFELLMAAGAPPMVMVVGGAGGVALVAAAWVGAQHRGLFAGLVLLGTVPFAAVAWTALVPVLLLAVASALAIAVARQTVVPCGWPGKRQEATVECRR